MDQGEGQRSEFVEDRKKRGRERRRDGLTRISVQWLQGCVESQPYTQIAVKPQSHTRSGLTRPGFRDSSAARRPSPASTRVTAQVRSYPPGSSFFPTEDGFCTLSQPHDELQAFLPVPVMKWRMTSFKEHDEKDGHY